MSQVKFLDAWSFLTIIPLPRRREASPEEVGHSLGYFSAVGLVIGLILAGLNWLLVLFLPPAIVNALLLVALVVITGALHLDGLSDTCDGIASHKTVEDRWRVMRDSHVGAFGVVGIVLLLLVQYVSLNSVPQSLLPTTLVLMPVVSRWAMVYAVFAYPYARPAGLGKVFKQGASWSSLALATLITLVVAIIWARVANFTFFYLVGLAIIVIIWVIVVAVATFLQRKFAGLTGDTYGAINELAEVCVLILVALLAYNSWFN